MQSKFNSPLLSLCIPTNGVIEWVFPVLDSIYAQGIDKELFEVVVTDNGDNIQFYEMMTEYCGKHSNITYEKTEAVSFLNEIESYKRATGKFIKFLNHRTLLLPNTLERLIEFVRGNLEEKPVIYFGNGIVKDVENVQEYKNFDEFVSGLSYWSSWSTGMGFWKEDFEKIQKGTVYNGLFPHTTILFHERKKTKYVLNNRVLLEEMSDDGIPKGRYDLFFAFAVEYPAILCELLRDGDISDKTFIKVKEELLFFIMEQYRAYVVKRRPCSYDLTSFDESIRIFYSKSEARRCYRKLRLTQIRKRLSM